MERSSQLSVLSQLEEASHWQLAIGDWQPKMA